MSIDATRLPFDSARDHMIERPLPNSAEAERAILGAGILDNSIIRDLRGMLSPAEMYVPSHRRCLAAMFDIYDRDHTALINPITIGEELRRDGSLEGVGGISFISNLMLGLPHFANVTHYVEIVKSKYALRMLIKACNRAVCEALEEEDLPEVILESALTMIQQIADPSYYRIATTRMDDWWTLEETAQEMETQFYPDLFHKRHNALSTGYPELDAELGMCGFGFDEMIVIAGRTSFGKTTLALNMASMMARQLQIKGEGTIGFVSREMSRQRLFKRIHAMQAQIEAGLIRPGMWDKTLQRLLSSVRLVGQLPILIDERTNSLPALHRQLRFGVEKRKMKACFIDYLQLMAGYQKRTGNRSNEVAEVARELKEFNKEFGIPIIPLSQLSRENMKENRRPVLSDLKESGEIEAAADTVLFVHGDEDERGQKLRSLQWIIGKQRDGIVHGPAQYIPLAFDTEMLTFHTPLFTRDFNKLAGTYDPDTQEPPSGEEGGGPDWSM